MKVEVTEFVRPNGAPRKHSVEVPDDCAVGYESLKRHKCRLTAESLMTGAVSQTVEHEEGDFLIEVTFAGQSNEEALIKMLREFDGAKFEEWLKEVQR